MASATSEKTQKGFIRRNWFILLLAGALMVGPFLRLSLHYRNHDWGGSISAVQGGLYLWGNWRGPTYEELFGFEAEFVTPAIEFMPHFHIEHVKFAVFTPLWLLLVFCGLGLASKEHRRKQRQLAESDENTAKNPS